MRQFFYNYKDEVCALTTEQHLEWLHCLRIIHRNADRVLKESSSKHSFYRDRMRLGILEVMLNVHEQCLTKRENSPLPSSVSILGQMSTPNFPY